MLEIGLTEHCKYCIIVLFFLPKILWGQFEDESARSLLKSSISDITQNNYDAAYSSLNIIQKDYPFNPLPNVYKSAIEITKSMDLGIEVNDEYVFSQLDSAEIKAERLFALDEENVWNIYFKGLVLGYRSYFNGLQGNVLTAFSEAKESVSYLEDCIEMDSAFYDAYAGIGFYMYWKSRKTEFINWLPIIADEKEEGVEMLETALDNEIYNDSFAATQLFWIYFDRENYKSAESLANRFLKKYPGSRLFKRNLAHVLKKTDKQKSVEVYEDLIYSYSVEGNISLTNFVVLKHKLAQIEFLLRNYIKVIRNCDNILKKWKVTFPKNDDLEDRIERVRKLRNKALKLTNGKINY